MRAIAILTMFVAWLIYGAMPALGSCPMCDQSIPQQQVTSMQMAGMSMPASPISLPAVDGQHSKTASPMDCLGHIAFCAFCLIVPPLAAIAEARSTAYSYPAPSLAHPLQDARPAPASPPPRFA